MFIQSNFKTQNYPSQQISGNKEIKRKEFSNSSKLEKDFFTKKEKENDVAFKGILSTTGKIMKWGGLIGFGLDFISSVTTSVFVAPLAVEIPLGALLLGTAVTGYILQKVFD
jgi:hypothetical protein